MWCELEDKHDAEGVTAQMGFAIVLALNARWRQEGEPGSSVSETGPIWTSEAGFEDLVTKL